MRSRRFLLPFMLILALISSGVSAQRVRYLSPEDSIQRVTQKAVDATPDSTRHGFFHAGKFHSSFHVQFEGDVTYIFRKVGAVTGFQVAWVINHKLSFGAKFNILTSTNVTVNKYVNSNDPINSTTPNPIRPLLMSGMVSVGYIINSGKKLSFEPSMGLGWAQIHFTDPRAGWIDQTEAKMENVTFNYFAINPSISMIWNATKVFRSGIVVGANGIFGKDYLRVKSYRVGGLYAGLFLRFGTF
ncbi:MAG: hypothetical protein JWO03_119 [Bacteroidetes bacterium]|nr:hypothetical protein [Bacteroidota bacterium]